MKPIDSQYRYFIGWLVIGQGRSEFKYKEVFPINNKTFKNKSVRNDGQIFFRKQFNGTPVLIGEDYALIKSIEQGTFPYYTPQDIDRPIFWQVKRKCNNQWEVFSEGQFNIYNCKFDEDKCKVEINGIVTRDKYTCVLENFENKHNFFDVLPVYSVNALNTQYQIEYKPYVDTLKKCHGTFSSPINPITFHPDYVSPGSNYGPVEYAGPAALYAEDWVIIEQSWEFINQLNSKFKIRTTWARLFTITFDIGGLPSPPVGSDWTDRGPVNGGYMGLPAHKFTNSSYPDTITSTGATISYGEPINSGMYTTYWKWNPYIGQEYTFTRNRKIEDVITHCLADCGLSLKSYFLNNATDLDTGLPLQNVTNHLMIAGKGDLKAELTSPAGAPQTVLNYSLKDIQEWFRILFNCYWYIDDDGYFRIEHISAFKKPSGINLLTLENGRYIFKSNRYSYDGVVYYKYERWTLEDSIGLDFKGNDISYDNLYSNIKTQAVQEYSPGLISTDLGYLIALPGSVNSEGFMLMACTLDAGVYNVINEPGKASGMVVSNGHLSVANLQEAYHQYDRVLPKGFLNNVLTTFKTSKKIIKQDSIQFPLCCDQELDETKLIKTTMGDGEVQDAEFDLMTNMQTVTLVY